jgi:hypothetical protein
MVHLVSLEEPVILPVPSALRIRRSRLVPAQVHPELSSVRGVRFGPSVILGEHRNDHEFFEDEAIFKDRMSQIRCSIRHARSRRYQHFMLGVVSGILLFILVACYFRWTRA